MWADVDWLILTEKPPAKSDTVVVARYMSSRYAEVRWGKDYVYVDLMRQSLEPYREASLAAEYKRTTVVIGYDAEGKEMTFKNWFKWWSTTCNISEFDEPVFSPGRGYVGERQLNLYRRDAVAAVEVNGLCSAGTCSKTSARATPTNSCI